MTIREFLTQELTDCGMFDTQAAGVIDLASRPESQGGMTQLNQRIDDDLSGYPPSFPAVLAFSIRGYALEWIDMNAPKAWFRPMFLSEEERNKLFPGL